MGEKFQKKSVSEQVHDLEKVNFEDVLEKKNPIIFDTNFLFVTFEFKIDVIADIEKLVGGTYSLYIYEGTIGELESIDSKKNKNKKFLPLIVSMLKRYGFKIISSDKSYVDEQILDNLDKRVYIATNDKGLRMKIFERNKDVPVILMRQKRYLAFA